MYSVCISGTLLLASCCHVCRHSFIVLNTKIIIKIIIQFLQRLDVLKYTGAAHSLLRVKMLHFLNTFHRLQTCNIKHSCVQTFKQNTILSSSRQHYDIDDCVEDNREDY